MTTADAERLEFLRELKLFSMEEAFKDMEPVTWYWEDWLAANPMVAFLYGIEGIGKTTVATSLLGVFTNGWPFPGTEIRLEDWPRYCYYINADGKNVALKQKMIDLGIEMSYILTPVLKHPDADYWRDPRITDIEDILHELEAIKVQKGRGPALIVLDGFSSFHGRLENPSHIANRTMRQVRQLANVGNCPLLIIHHANKPDRFTKNLTKAHRLRGSSAFGASAEMMLMIDHHGGKLRLEVTKSNIGPIPEPIVFTIGKHGLECEGFIPVRARQPTKEDTVRDWLNETLQDGPRPMQHILEEAMTLFGASRSTIYNAKQRCAIVQSNIAGQQCWGLAEPVQKPR